jgi:serine/threonine protein phosphatase PrpC
MSTHYHISRKRKGIRLARLVLLSILGVLGIALQTLLFSSSPVLAASAQRAATAPPSEAVGRAGASVVRLLVTYSSASTPASTIQCTGLGTIVASWASHKPTDQNNWVLTDGSLVNPDGEATCLPTHPKARLTTIAIMLSRAYNPQVITAAPSAPVATAVHCFTAGACQSSAVLLAFSTQHTLPFLDVASLYLVGAQPVGIALSQTATDLAVPPSSNTDQPASQAYAQSLLSSLIPLSVSLSSLSSASSELGLPLVDQQGHLVSIYVNSLTLFSTQDITSFLAQQIKPPPHHDNPVHDHWNAGITAFYQGSSHYSEARSDFEAVLAANPQFLGAQTFLQLTNPATSPPATSGQTNKLGSNSSSNSVSDGLFSSSGLSLMLKLGTIIGVVVLLFVVIILLRWWLQQRKADRMFKEAKEFSETTLEPQLRREEQARMQQQTQRRWAEQPTLTPETAPAAFGQSITAPLPCPNCQKPIQRGITRCPYCGVSLLAPTDSGFYPRTQFATPPHVPPGRPNGIENQPTREMSPSLEQMSPSGPRNGLSDSEKTRPAVRQGKNQNLGFSVVTRTNVGKKRKHKPNEDSLFAAQGVRDASYAKQQVGLFVVADGMGGHANGQDASQTAIQEIINYILPRLAQSGEMSGDAYKQLLTEGVQCANQAVHQRNLEQRADMGTTMTAALVVAPLGSTYAEDDTRPPSAIAYVANVGDSRTYLYRKTQGLRKLTNDHSVVASLVEAGIIRPDDIYTHPKRNQIYRSLGEKPAVEVDAFMYSLDVDDKLLLCSDGLWDMVRDPKIEEVLKSYDPDQNLTGDMLIQAALEGGGEDNVSVIVVYIPDLSRQNAQLGIQLIDKPEPVQLPPM